MRSEWLVRVGLALLTAIGMAVVPYALVAVQGEAGLPADWADRVLAGEWFRLVDLGIGLHIGLRDGELVLRETPRWFPALLGLPGGSVFVVVGGLLLYGCTRARTGFERLLFGSGGVLSVGAGLMVLGLVTRGSERVVHPDRLEITHSVAFGAAWWTTEREVRGTVQWRLAEECSDVEGETVCLYWVFVEVPTDHGFVRLARLPHSNGVDPDYDAAQEEAGSSLVRGIQRILGPEG